MADTELESMSVRLKGDASDYERMLKDSQRSTASFASEILSTLGGMASGSINVLQGMASTITSTLQGLTNLVPVVGGIASAVIGTLGGAAGGFIQWLKSSTDEMLELDNQARRLGLTLNELQVAMHWSADAKALPEILNNASNSLMKARQGSMLATQDIRMLATAAGSVTKASTVPQLIDQLSSITDPAKRAELAFRTLGSSAKDVLAALSRPGGMGESKRFLDNLGMGTSEADIANLRAVQQAMKDIEQIWKGVMQQALLAIAPFLRALSEMFDPKNVRIDGIRDAIGTVIRAVGMFGAFIFESTKDTTFLFDAFKIGLDLASAGFKQLGSVALETMGIIADAITSTIAGPIRRLVGKEKFDAAFSVLRIISPASGNVIDAADLGKTLRDAAAEQRRLSGTALTDATNKFTTLSERVRTSTSGQAIENWVKLAEKFNGALFGAADRIERVDLRWLEQATNAVNNLRRQAMNPMDNFVQQMEEMKSLQGDRAALNRAGFMRDAQGWFRMETYPEKQIVEEEITDIQTGEITKVMNEVIRQIPFKFRFNEDRMREIARDRRLNPDIIGGFPGLEGLSSFRSFRGLLSGLNIPAIPQLPGAAEFRSKEAFSAEAQFRLLQDRPSIEQEILNAANFAKEQRDIQIRVGKEVAEAMVKLNTLIERMFTPQGP